MASHNDRDAQDPFSQFFSLTDNGDPGKLRSLFASHRLIRQHDQRALLLTSHAVKPDAILAEILQHGEQIDDRHGLNIVARPNAQVMRVIADIQRRLSQLERNLRLDGALWLAPAHMLHITLLEWISDADKETVDRAAANLSPRLLDALTW
jgi:hypothetical protein